MDPTLVPNQPVASEPTVQSTGQSGSGSPPPQATQDASPLDLASLLRPPLPSDTQTQQPPPAPAQSGGEPTSFPTSEGQTPAPSGVGQAGLDATVGSSTPVVPASPPSIAEAPSSLPPNLSLEQPLIVTQGAASPPLSSPVMESQPTTSSSSPETPKQEEQGGTQASDPPSDPTHHWFQSKTAALVLVLLTVGIAASVVLFFRQQEAKPITSQPAPETPKVLSLSIESPTDGTVATDGEVMVKGKTLPNTLIVFYTDTADNSVESDGNGNFEGKLALVSGINTLTVTAVDERGEEKSVVLDLVYDEQ